MTSFFKVTFRFPKWRSLKPWKGHLWIQTRSLWRTWESWYGMVNLYGFVCLKSFASTSFNWWTVLGNKTPKPSEPCGALAFPVQESVPHYEDPVTRAWQKSTPLKINCWNPKITQLKRKIIFQTSIFGFKMLIFRDVIQSNRRVTGVTTSQSNVEIPEGFESKKQDRILPKPSEPT